MCVFIHVFLLYTHVILLHVCIGVTTLAYGHKDIKRIVGEQRNQHSDSRCGATAGIEAGGLVGEEAVELENETEEQVNQLTERLYLKIQSIPICHERIKTAIDDVCRLSGGRITPLDAEKFLELLSEDSRFTLDKTNTLRIRIKNLLKFRSRK